MMKYIKRTTNWMWLIVAILVCSCNSKRPETISSLYSTVPMETTSMGIRPNGDVEMRVWGHGNSEEEAIQNACINAVSDVLFKGIHNGVGTNTHQLFALVNDPAVKNANQYYFNAFLSKGGDYRHFVKENKDAVKARKMAKHKGNYNASIIVVVNREALKDNLKAHGILP